MKLRFLAAAAALAASPASAQEIFGGIYAHDVDWVTRSGIESGVDVQIGWRGGRILPEMDGPQPYVFVSANSAGDTHFAAAGLSWKIGKTLYVRPGVGLAVHSGPDKVAPGRRRIDFGSPILFEPEIGIGYQINDRFSLEASWVHLSHATIFSRNNPGLDTVGVRLNVKLR